MSGSPALGRLFGIGYATKPIQVFLGQLQTYNVDVVADVRSVPYSRAFHDFNREALIQHLASINVKYVYLGDELGPRSKVSEHYNETGQVQFDRLMRSPLFLKGVDRLKVGLAKGYNIALMCAEKDAAVCHRSLLIGYALKHTLNMELLHIGFEGDLESQAALEKRLLAETNTFPDIFTSEAECEALAYKKQTLKMAYKKP